MRCFFIEDICCILIILSFFLSFVSESNNQTDITLVKKFSQWNYVVSSLRERMPYLTLNNPNTLLTTAENPDSNQFGTIVSRNASHSPALWIESVAPNPQAIWYWLREAKGTCSFLELICCIKYFQCCIQNFVA